MFSRQRIVSALAGLAVLIASARGDEPKLGKAEFGRLLEELNLKNQPWASIPWKNTLPEARAQAAKDKKPIFMVVNTGNCLGFV